MISIISPRKAQMILAEQVRARRLRMELTQEGLAMRSGVPLPTLRKFEQKGAISLESFLKLQLALGGLEEIVEAARIKDQFLSIQDVVRAEGKTERKRGSRK